MSTLYPLYVPFIQENDPLTPEHANKSAVILAQRTDWLYHQLNALKQQAFVVLYQQPISETVQVGMPVYYRAETQSYHPAYDVLNVDNPLSIPTSAMVSGVVRSITNSVAEIVIYGAMSAEALNWWQSLFITPVKPGPVYLSHEAGKYTTQESGNGIYIGHLMPDGTLIVAPSRAPTYTTYTPHNHIAISLSCAPAGTANNPSGPSEVHTITEPDTSLRGWLPVTAADADIAPAGARFKYNIDHASETIVRHMVPYFARARVVFAYQYDRVIPIGRVLVNGYGIWWMSNSYGTAPWSVNYISNPSAYDIILMTVIPSAFDYTRWINQELMEYLAQSNVMTALATTNPDHFQIDSEVAEYDAASDKTWHKRRVVVAPKNTVFGIKEAHPDSGLEVQASHSFSYGGSSWGTTRVTLRNTGVRRVYAGAGIVVTSTPSEPNAGRLRLTNTRAIPLIYNNNINVNEYYIDPGEVLRMPVLSNTEQQPIVYIMPIDRNEFPVEDPLTYAFLFTIRMYSMVESTTEPSSTIAIRIHDSEPVPGDTTQNYPLLASYTFPISNTAAAVNKMQVTEIDTTSSLRVGSGSEPSITWLPKGTPRELIVQIVRYSDTTDANVIHTVFSISCSIIPATEVE